MSRPRSGAILIIAAGMLALLSALALTFFVRMRQDVEETRWVVKHTQCRLMLMAACNYILESGRIGWDDPATPVKEEAYGWVDVRDGYLGPKRAMVPLSDRQVLLGPDYGGPNLDESQRQAAILAYAVNALPAYRPLFPIGQSARFPMHVWERTRWAISPAPANPVESDPSAADFGMPYLRHPSPMVAGAAPGQASAAALTWAQWSTGESRIRQESMNLAWFRVLRDGPDTFVVTVGSGGTHGFRSWAEVDAQSRSDLFSGGETAFDEAQAYEVRLWYRVAWSPAIATATSPYSINNAIDNYNFYGHSGSYGRSTPLAARENAVGTIAWIQRLRTQPREW